MIVRWNDKFKITSVKYNFSIFAFLPEYVQKKACLPKGQGLSQYDVETLAALPARDVEDVYQQIITSKGKPNQKPVRKRSHKWLNRPRGKLEIGEMIAHLMQLHRLSTLTIKEMECATAALSWVTKATSSVEFLEERLDFPKDYVIVDNHDHVTGFNEEWPMEIGNIIYVGACMIWRLIVAVMLCILLTKAEQVTNKVAKTDRQVQINTEGVNHLLDKEIERLQGTVEQLTNQLTNQQQATLTNQWEITWQPSSGRVYLIMNCKKPMRIQMITTFTKEIAMKRFHLCLI